MTLLQPKVNIYTDGACKGNPGPGGYGVILVSGRSRKELSQGYQKTTNQRMELMAVIAALDALKKSSQVKLFTDSMYVRKGITEWVKRWQKNGWMTTAKKPVKNRDLWERLVRTADPHDINWQWIKGHAGHPENERCDALATEASFSENQLVDIGFG